MKKILIPLLAVLLLLSHTPMSAQAKELSSYTSVYQDGEYTIEVTTTIVKNPSFARSSNSKTATKTAYIKDTYGNSIASFSLTATFSYNGSSVNCTSVSHSKAIFNTSWSFTTATFGKSTSFATGYYTVKHYVNGVEKDSISGTLRISCDKNGNIS